MVSGGVLLIPSALLSYDKTIKYTQRLLAPSQKCSEDFYFGD